MKDQIEKPDWDYKKILRFERITDSHGRHWYELQGRSHGLKGWRSLGRFNQSMIIDLLVNCHDALDECETIDALEELYLQNT